MKINIQSPTSIVIEIKEGKKFRVQTESLVSEHLYIGREDESPISVSGFTDRTVKLGEFKDIKVG